MKLKIHVHGNPDSEHLCTSAGELELPEWLSENEKFHRLLSMAERLVS